MRIVIRPGLVNGYMVHTVDDNLNDLPEECIGSPHKLSTKSEDGYNAIKELLSLNNDELRIIHNDVQRLHKLAIEGVQEAAPLDSIIGRIATPDECNSPFYESTLGALDMFISNVLKMRSGDASITVEDWFTDPPNKNIARNIENVLASRRGKQGLGA